MLTAMLLIGMLWPSIAPLTIAPGMTSDQVYAILGERPGTVFTAADVVVAIYGNSRLELEYSKGKVKTVIRLKK